MIKMERVDVGQIQNPYGAKMIKKALEGSYERVLFMPRDKNGYIDISEEEETGGFKRLNKTAFLDTTTGLIYRFKSNDESGGYFKYTKKEIFETLISRMVAEFMETVTYYPAIYKGEPGVICLDWNNGGKNQSLLSDIIDANKLSVFDNKKYINILSKGAVEDFRKVPQHLFVGNNDYSAKNLTYNNDSLRVGELISFDYGFSSFVRVEELLRQIHMELTAENIEIVFREFMWGRITCEIGMGANHNLSFYKNYEALIEDFKAYASAHPHFKQNIRESIDLAEKFEDKFAEMEWEGYPLSNKNKEVVKTITEVNLEGYSRCL